MKKLNAIIVFVMLMVAAKAAPNFNADVIIAKSIIVTNTLSITNGTYRDLYFADGRYLRTNTASPNDWEFHSVGGVISYGLGATTKLIIGTDGSLTSGVGSFNSVVSIFSSAHLANNLYTLDGGGNIGAATLTLGTSGVLQGGVNTIEQKNSTSAQTFNVYQSYTDASNYKRLSTLFNGNDYITSAEGSGTGTNSGDWFFKISGSHSLRFWTKETERWRIENNGQWSAGTDNSWDIGASGANRPRSGYFGTSANAPMMRTGSMLITNGVLELNGVTASQTSAGWKLDNSVDGVLTFLVPGPNQASFSLDSHLQQIRAETGFSFSGDASSLTALNGSQITSGTISQDRLGSTITTNNGTLSSASLVKGNGARGVTEATAGVDYVVPANLDYPSNYVAISNSPPTGGYVLRDSGTTNASGAEIYTNGPSIAYTHKGTTTNITATFNGTLQTFTCTNGPSSGQDYFFHYAGANGSVSYRFSGSSYNNLHFDYDPKWLTGSNSVITNGVLSITSYGGTNAAQLEAAMKENQ